MADIKNIFCNGDSFTAGVSLADFLIPTYKGPFELKEELLVQRQEFINFKNIFLDTNYACWPDLINYQPGQHIPFSIKKAEQDWVKLEGNWDRIEKKHAWPKHLSSLSNYNTYNYARGGNSIQSILLSTILGINALEKQGVKIDLVIIQITSLFRTEFFSAELPNIILSRNLGFPDEKFQKAVEEYVRVQDECDLFIKYLYTLVAITEFVKLKTGRYPVYIDASFGEDIQKFKKIVLDIQKEDSIKDFLFSLIELSRLETIHINFMLDTLSEISKPWENCGHYTEEGHVLTARKLINLIKEIEDKI